MDVREALLFLESDLTHTEDCIRVAELEGRERAARALRSSAEAYRMAIDALKRNQPTIADRIRAMVATDEGIAKILMALDISLAEDGKEFTTLYCDGKNNCITEDDNIICTDEMRTACILRWLQQLAKEE